MPIPSKTIKQIEFFYLHATNREKPLKIKIKFKTKTHKIKDLKNDLADLVEADPNKIIFKFLTYSTIKKFEVHDSMLTKELRKKSKYQNLFSFEKLIYKNDEKSEEEIMEKIEKINIEGENKKVEIDLEETGDKQNKEEESDKRNKKAQIDKKEVEIIEVSENQKKEKVNAEEKNELNNNELKQEEILEINVSIVKKNFYYGSFSKRAFTFMRPFFFKNNSTTKDMHLKIFNFFRVFFEEFYKDKIDNICKLNDFELYLKIFENKKEEDFEKKPYSVLLVTDSKGFDASCSFCGNNRCENCNLPFSKKEKLINLMLKLEKKSDFEIEVLWDNDFIEKIDIGKLNSYSDYNKNQEIQLSSKNENKSLYDCLNLFTEPEQLSEAEAWYCSHCKKHQKAIKQMAIYKAPKLLIFHLKRFKNQSFTHNSKVTTKIDFPIEDLDLSNFVLNDELPEDYFDSKRNKLNIDELYLRKEKKTEIKMEENSKENIQENTQENIKETIEEKMDEEKNEEKKNEEKKKEENAEEKMNEEKQEEKKNEDNLGQSKSSLHCIGNSNDKIMIKNRKNKHLYDLFAISNHYGDVGYGHYTAFSKNHFDNNWYQFDDSRISQETPLNIVTDAAYLLFYKRKSIIENNN